MTQLNLQLDRQFEVNSELFGSFLEHMGTVIYTGIYEPTHPTATSEGFRGDVLKLVRTLGIKTVRYPGGNYTSSYHWEDSIGNQRPRRMNLAWQAVETNEFGLNEFFQWAERANVTNPILTVNLGTRGIDDALHELEYVNGQYDTEWANLRRAHGHEEPYRVKYWCLGNELDGPWQVAQKTPEAYGKLANETAKAMKLMDPNIKTILVGSSTPRLDSYPSWDFKVLMAAYENVDYLAMHNYIDRRQPATMQDASDEPDDLLTYLARSREFDQQIEEIETIADAVKALKHSSKTMMISFDEWNVHRSPLKAAQPWTTRNPIDWCYFDLADTLLFGSMALAILRHGDRVKLSCQALLVNTIPLILTDENGRAWTNPTYDVLQSLIKNLSTDARVISSAISNGETYDTAQFEAVPLIDQVVIQNEMGTVVFAVNRSSEVQTCQINLPSPVSQGKLEELTGNLEDQNTREHPETLKLRERQDFMVQEGSAKQAVTLAPYSWSVVTFTE